MAHAGPGGEVLLGEGIAWMSTFGGHPARPGLLLPVRPNVTELSEWGFGLGSQGCCHCGVTLMQPVPFCTICLDRREGDDLACAITPALGFSKPVTCESPFVYLQSARKWYQCRVRLLQTLLFGHQAVAQSVWVVTHSYKNHTGISGCLPDQLLEPKDLTLCLFLLCRGFDFPAAEVFYHV